MNTTKEHHMSAKFPMVSLDKLEVKLTVQTKKVVAVDKIARMSGLSRASVINGYIDDGLRRSKVTLDMDDYKRIDEIRAENAAKRAAIKAKKGAR